MKNHVITVSVEANAAGYDLGVQEATITLGVNDIPTIELMCAPTKGKPSPLEPKVVRPTISEFADMYRDLSEKAEGLSEAADVSISIKDSEGRTDSIALKNWVLAGAGLSGIGASQAPYLSVVLQHPICKLTKTGSVYEEPEDDPSIVLNEISEDSTDILEIMEEVYRFFREELTYYPSGGVAEQFTQRLGVDEFDPAEYLEFKGDHGIFLGGEGDELDAVMAKAMARLVFPSDGGSSTWDALVSATGSLMLSITQDKERNFTTDKLVLEPLQPWKDVGVILNEDDCVWTEVPGMDPFKIIGVMCRRMGPFNNISGGEDQYANGNDNDEDPVSVFMYAPVENPSVASGRIMKVDHPAVLDSAFRRAAEYGDDLAGGQTDMDEERAELYELQLAKYCKAVYDCSAASMVRAKAQMALWFKDRDGNLILPGNTCLFQANGKKGPKDIYYGYIQQVVHHLSTSGGCSTTVVMSHVRPQASYYVGGELAIKIGEKNAAYSSSYDESEE